MPLVTFQPSGKSIEVASGIDLMEAARRAGVAIDAPCGGKGTCGKCLVKVLSGTVQRRDGGVIDPNDPPGIVTACTVVPGSEALTVEVPKLSGYDGGKFAEDAVSETAQSGLLIPCDPITRQVAITVNQPAGDAVEPDVYRLLKSLAVQGCNTSTEIPLFVLRNLAAVLREDDGRVTVTVSHPENPPCTVIDVTPGDRTSRHFGIAVDIGTTTIAVQLVHLDTGAIKATAAEYNGQIPCGLDVISRINYAHRRGGLEELKQRVTDTINRLIGIVCINGAIGAGEICEAVFSGNTTMTHLLLGINPEYIRLHPYTPTLLDAKSFSARDLGINSNPNAPVYCSPGVGSYVGGDITAGLLCTEIPRSGEGTYLFLDIGTNGELVVGNRDALMTCACSAGPAFEGGGISCGMRAATGAIEGVEIDAATGKPRVWTVGSAAPRGICGSGMIGLVAELFLKGLIDPAGKFDRSGKFESIQVAGRQAYFELATVHQSDTGKAITVSETDIDNLIRAKAAIYSACALMMRQLELSFEGLDCIYIAGGFGRFLDIEKAIVIGLLPDVARAKFHYIGNSSLNGSYRVLISRKQRMLQQVCARAMTYIDLSNDSGYMDQYTAALFLPHTDKQLFPSVNIRR